MTFIHNFLPRQELVATTTTLGRTYVTPIGPLPSVTTVIGKTLDKSGLKKWREAEGEAKANQILFQAQQRGNEIHSLAERYVMNDPDYRQGIMPLNLDTFNQIKRVIDENLQMVYGLELPLWSKVLKTAGQADMVGNWSGKNAVIDYKTSRKPKTEEHCLGYMLQGTTYALMMWERYHLDIPLVVVILAVDHEPFPTVYTVPTTKYYKQVENIFINQREYA